MANSKRGSPPEGVPFEDLGLEGIARKRESGKTKLVEVPEDFTRGDLMGAMMEKTHRAVSASAAPVKLPATTGETKLGTVYYVGNKGGFDDDDEADGGL